VDGHDYSESELEKRLLEYLHLEFGENFKDDNALKLSDLNYQGDFILDGESKQCWSFPSSPPEMWATACQKASGKWIFSMQKKPDFGKPKSEYEKLDIQVHKGDSIQQYQYEFEASDEHIWEVDDKEIIIENKKIIIFGSVNSNYSPPMIDVTVEYKSRTHSFTCSQSIYANFYVDDEVYLMINVGDIDSTFVE